ncbi:MAG: hypothetical protein SH847_06555 [Roseiflexaceae bacterium]|nr:hypothetical protein [Roseiflexaceae bacterium]
MKRLLSAVLCGVIVALLIRWYERETIAEGEGTVWLQSEHEHFHMHVDLPDTMEIEPGDTLHVLTMPDVPHSETQGEITYNSPVRLYKASWLRRNLVKSSSLIEVNELVEHP